MDIRISPSKDTYKLVNTASGKIEASGLGRIDARDYQNRLGARGIFTTLEKE